MRILHLEAGRHLYGGARQVAYLINASTERGIENVLVCRPGHPLLEIVDGTRTVEWPLGGDLDVSLYRRLKRLIQAYEPDLLHVHSRRGADSFGGFAARAAGRPAVMTRRVQSAEPKLWLRLKCRPYAAIAAISTAVHEELAGAGVARSRLRLIPSAVDAARFRPDPLARAKLVDRYDLPGDALIAGAAAQLIRRKGLDALPRLASRWSEAEPRFRLLVFGQGGRGPALERRVAALGLTDTIRLCGYERDWPELVPGLDLFLHPARREGLGLAVLEAMSAGVPVVAAAVGGIVDAIEDGVDGRLLPPAAFERWYACVLDLLRDADTRARLGRAARRKVESAFTIARMTESYIALYRDVAGHGGR